MTAGFDEIVLSNKFGYGSQPSISFNTDVTLLKNKREQRNQNWSVERREFDLMYPIKSQTDLDALLLFFRRRAGKARGFRQQDPTDYKSCIIANTPAATDQLCGGVADGSNAFFQLQKNFTDALGTYVYPVYKPQTGSVLVSVNGTLQPLTTNYLIDYTTGLITFQSGHIPAAAALVKAGFLYHVPVRFDIDKMATTLDDFNASSVGQTQLVEIYPY